MYGIVMVAPIRLLPRDRRFAVPVAPQRFADASRTIHSDPHSPLPTIATGNHTFLGASSNTDTYPLSLPPFGTHIQRVRAKLVSMPCAELLLSGPVVWYDTCIHLPHPSLWCDEPTRASTKEGNDETCSSDPQRGC
jgi:hypothetical protein